MELQIPLPQWKIKNRHGVIQQRAIYRERNGPFRPAWFQLLIHLLDPTQFGQLGSPPPGSLEGATVRAHGRHVRWLNRADSGDSSSSEQRGARDHPAKPGTENDARSLIAGSGAAL